MHLFCGIVLLVWTQNQLLGLVGQDDWEAAQIDALADFHKDFGNETQDYIMILTGRRQGDKETVYKEKFLPAVEKTFPILNL